MEGSNHLAVRLRSRSRRIFAGQINFNNRITGTVDARVLLDGSIGAGAGWTAQLIGGRVGGTLVPLFPTTTFRTTSAAAQGYVNPVVVTVPGILPGEQASVKMQVFNGPTFGT